MENQNDYGEEYIELQEKLIPGMASSLRSFDDLLEKVFGYRLSEPLPNIEVQYNNASIYVDWEFKKAGIHDFQDNLVRESIKSNMQDIVYRGAQALTESTNLIAKHAPEEKIMEGIEIYKQADEKLWKYDYREDLVDHIMLYFLESYFDVKRQWEEDERKGGSQKKYTVDDILTQDMLDEVLETLKKLELPEQVLLEAEEKWYEVLLDVIRQKEKDKERKLKHKKQEDNLDLD